MALVRINTTEILSFEVTLTGKKVHQKALQVRFFVLLLKETRNRVQLATSGFKFYNQKVL